MSVKVNLIKALHSLLSQARNLSAWIPVARQASRGDYEHWAPKDLIAHSAEWTKRQIRLLSDSNEVTQSKDDDSVDINCVFFERNKDKLWKDIIEMLQESIEAMIQQVECRDEASFTAVDPHGGGQNPVWVGIAYYGVAHTLSHVAQALVRGENSDAAVKLQRTMTPSLMSVNSSGAWKGMVELYLARVLSIAGNLEEAISQYKKAITNNPSLAQYAADEVDLEPIRGKI